MSNSLEITRPLPGARFGGTVRLAGKGGQSDARAVIDAADAAPNALPEALA